MHAIRIVCLALAAWLLLVSPLHAQPQDARALYESACAACHGADGRGMPRQTLGFDLEVPDFTDCSFATVEPDADWFAVAHDGGPARAFDRRMPAFGEALSDAELQAILDHVRTFCGDRRWPRGELNLPRALGTEKAFPENETVITTIVGTGRAAGHVENELLYEQRIGARAQFEIVVPWVSHETDAGWRNGPGDVAVALKRVLTHGLATGHILSVTAEAVFPTGDADAGLGSGTGVFEPFLTYGQILPANAFLQAQAGFELLTNGERESFWRVAMGRTFEQGRFGRAWSPMVELLAARELEGGATTHWDVLPQIQITLNRRQHIMINVGVRVPLNDRAGRNTQLITYFLWDWFDGGLLDGW